MTRINFQPYATAQLEEIVHARLVAAKENLPPQHRHDVITADGVKFASMKVSSISGDARRVLDICRRAAELVHPKGKTAGMEDVKEVIKVMQNSPTAAFLKELSFHEKIMLAALVKCMKREGVEEIKWGEVGYSIILLSDVTFVAFDRLSANTLSMWRPSEKGCPLVHPRLGSSPSSWTPSLHRGRCSWRMGLQQYENR
jgi:origin recognition complex subunit 1